jgi:hypothetical protein
MINWGSVPEWFSGVGAVFALFFAAGAAWAAIRAIHLQNIQISRMERAEQGRQEEHKREQANQVAAWVVLDSQVQPSVMCVNLSGRPVYNVQFMLRAGPRTTLCEYAVKGPDASAKQLNFASKRMLRLGHPTDADWTELYRSGNLRVSMRFEDVMGNTWQRNEEGELADIQPASEVSSLRVVRNEND